MSDAKRFFVDERAGCVAVRDWTLTDPDYQGLHRDTPGVVWYRLGGETYEPCPTCKHPRPMGWVVDPADVREAHAVCAKLNGESINE